MLSGSLFIDRCSFLESSEIGVIYWQSTSVVYNFTCPLIPKMLTSGPRSLL